MSQEFDQFLMARGVYDEAAATALERFDGWSQFNEIVMAARKLWRAVAERNRLETDAEHLHRVMLETRDLFFSLTSGDSLGKTSVDADVNKEESVYVYSEA